MMLSLLGLLSFSGGFLRLERVTIFKSDFASSQDMGYDDNMPIPNNTGTGNGQPQEAGGMSVILTRKK